MKKAAIITGYTCNNNCLFCYDSEKRENNIPDLKTDEIKSMLKSAKESGCSYVDFLGGEFTIRRDAIELISYARSLDFETIAVTTNGRAFSYMDILKRFVSAGMNSIIFSVHGNNAELHDKLTNVSGSFAQLKKGIENAKELHLLIYTNTTITKINLPYLEDIGRFLIKLGTVNSEFIFLDPTTGKGRTDFDNLMPKIKESAEPIRKLLELGKKHKISHWHIRYYPLCYLEGYEEYVSELHEKAAFEAEIHLGPEFTNTEVRESRKIIGKTKGKQCKLCKYDNVCEGVWTYYAEKNGTDELVPVNSY
jgi:MoaA/NifB/PqqE/SkfB family radical SAM enzyme